MTKYLFIALLLSSCTYALVRGRSDERIAALGCLLATIASVVLVTPYHYRYRFVERGELVIDLLMLMLFVLLALRSFRFWPLWVAGLQLTITISHVLKAVDQNLIPQVYAVAERMWSYPILIILILGTWRGTRQRPEQLGLPS